MGIACQILCPYVWTDRPGDGWKSSLWGKLPCPRHRVKPQTGIPLLRRLEALDGGFYLTPPSQNLIVYH